MTVRPWGKQPALVILHKVEDYQTKERKKKIRNEKPWT
jgi:hypothetical protein